VEHVIVQSRREGHLGRLSGTEYRIDILDLVISLHFKLAALIFILPATDLNIYFQTFVQITDH
jgi:hypothetical protein